VWLADGWRKCIARALEVGLLNLHLVTGSADVSCSRVTDCVVSPDEASWTPSGVCIVRFGLFHLSSLERLVCAGLVYAEKAETTMEREA
jgi:hypothetical protein